MAFKNLLFKTCAVTGLCISLAALPGYTFQPYGNQTLGSGRDVYRVELRDLGPLRVLSTGERNNDTGELHKIEVSLEGAGQVDGFYETSRTIRNPGHASRSGVVDIELNNQLSFRQDRLPAGASHNLWIHARKNGDGFATAVTLKIKATELDCVGQRVCDSGNTGTLSLTFDLPTFDSPPPSTCGSTNTFRIGHSLPQGGMIDGLTNHSHYEGGSFGTTTLAQGTAPTVNLQPTSGAICIASTHKPARYIKNLATGRCLSLPFGGVPNVADVYVPECRNNRDTALDRKAQWRITRKTGDYWSVKNTATNHCLNAKSSQAGANGGLVMAVGCSSHDDQSWRKIGRTRGQYILKNVSTDRCLTNEDGRAMERPCTDRPAQLWKSISEY